MLRFVRTHTLGLLALCLGVLLLGTALAQSGAEPPELAGSPSPQTGTSTTADGSSQSADLIYLFNGKVAVRARAAATLYHQGVAPRIALAVTAAKSPKYPTYTFSELIVEVMVGYHGVPREAIDLIPYPGGVANTRDEAQVLNRYLERYPARRIVVVTTDYHTRRVSRVLQQELNPGPDIRIAAVRDDNGIDCGTWWKTGADWVTCGSETAKLALTLVRADQLFDGR